MILLITKCSGRGQKGKGSKDSGSCFDATLVTSDLEVHPSVQRDEPLSVLNIDVASKQQQGERRDQRCVSQVDLGVFHLRTNRY